MNIEYLFRAFTDRADNRRAKSQVGNKMPVHDVYMDVVCTGIINRHDFLAEF